MPFIDTETLTLEELDTLTLEGVDSSLCVNESYTGNPSSKRLFRNRLFAGRLFAPALWRGLGEEVEGVFAHGCGPKKITNIGPQKITATGQLGKECDCG